MKEETKGKITYRIGENQVIIDPLLGNYYNVRSIWKIAEKALMCLKLHGSIIPSTSEVLNYSDNIGILSTTYIQICSSVMAGREVGMVRYCMSASEETFHMLSLRRRKKLLKIMNALTRGKLIHYILLQDS
ncbi:hypothetical protein MKW98_028320 [Papaver atlanticum]|uniref:Uncharacterized protein n=1 Tax=Papaver atlanticum TaxID=357466 RepID=A0AAD4XKD9_9MAGN|nr:hypothetical protein MKW98_028320 [Papaver atlanticum]